MKHPIFYFGCSFQVWCSYDFHKFTAWVALNVYITHTSTQVLLYGKKIMCYRQILRSVSVKNVEKNFDSSRLPHPLHARQHIVLLSLIFLSHHRCICIVHIFESIFSFDSYLCILSYQKEEKWEYKGTEYLSYKHKLHIHTNRTSQ